VLKFLKVKCDETLSNFAFTTNLRRYNLVSQAQEFLGACRGRCRDLFDKLGQGATEL
jgi:hypothetical protein